MDPTRRDVLRWAAAGAAAGATGPLWARPQARAGAGGRRLVMIHLDGGNDGLNTVVPVGDDRYHRARPRLRIRGGDAPRLDAGTVLHPALSAWRRLHEEGRLSVIRDVGWARPESSHAAARDRCHRGRCDAASPDAGWLGRAAARARVPAPPVAVGVARPPLLLRGGPRAARVVDASTGLSGRLRRIAKLLRAEDGPAVTWTRLGGFDTHAAQADAHAELLARLGEATAAFLRDLQRDGSDARTLVLIYSEFGRSVCENSAGGTDHGGAGPVFALGGGVRGGLIGAPPDLDGRAQHDFRALFCETLEDWLGWPAAGLFDGGHADGRSRVAFLAG